jgi:glucosamine-6-phosphate deaminase
MATPAQPSTAARSFAVDALSVRVFPSLAALAQDAAREAQATLSQALAARGAAAAILATGNSQLAFLDALVALGGVDWSKVTLFHMDEYLGLPATHSASFRRYMRERVEQRVRPKAFNYLAADSDQPIAECRRYEQALRAQPIDLCCLGIGENGHLAFNDPPVASFDEAEWVKIVKLDEGCRAQQVGEGHFPSIDAMPQYALTLTIPALCAARRMLAIVPEKRKAPAVRASLRDPISTACPGTFLRRQAHCTLFLDQDSASAL